MNRIFRSTLALLAVLAICAQVSAMQPSVESKSYSDLIGRFDQAPSLKLEPLDYAKSMNRGTRWLIQNIYSPENSYHIPNPLRAQGGSIRDSKEETVRTDAVCHGGNSLVGVLGLPGLSLSLQLPEANQAPIPAVQVGRTK